MKILEEQGYLIVAAGDNTYKECAIKLAQSIKKHNKINSVCLLTDHDFSHSVFDYCKTFPYPIDTSNFYSVDWQVFYTSPFRETIKLEADMLVANNIDHYWDIVCKRDVVISTGARNFYNQTATSRHYRSLFDQNHLPDVYNALTYWRLSNTAKEFFDLVRNIFENWEQFKQLIKYPEPIPSTDVVYGIAAKILGPERVTLPEGLLPSIVHMKKYINPLQTSNWTRELVWESTDTGLKVNTVHQNGVFHYYIKDWLSDE